MRVRAGTRAVGFAPARSTRVRTSRTSARRSAQVRVDLGDRDVPRLGGRDLATLDGVESVLHRGADHRLLTADVLRLERERRLREDLAVRGVVEERVRRVLDLVALEDRLLRGQVPDVLEDADLLLGLDQPLDELVGRLVVGRLRRDGPEGTAPVAAAARDRREVPLALGRRRGVLDVTAHPRGARKDGEVTVLEARVPLVRPRREVRRQARLDDREGRVEGDLRATVERELLVLGEGGDGLLAEHRLVDVHRVVDELLAGLLDVLLAELDEVLPRAADGRRDLLARVRQAGSLE